ncbi:ATP-binding protein [Methanobrevibacter curvatus]|uniref:Magnesium-chelatase 38 kDa subunit n=1 Tax=Methanobrevibacter curvatus TaxID=49547 RepID=A0A166BDS9_9EURY|nr:ATP-binding protein [Methanobrevibacter curvatus]KZX13199.1 magnesium-chelatase 38 kDa subunit [Methanobrevibacter curvatus]
MKNITFPFSAIVGQGKIKRALILNAINPSIGGILIRGDRGTGKTTAVRALADLLPEIEAVENCPFSCDTNTYLDCEICSSIEEPKFIKKPMKVVELPLGATEDRVLGSLNIEKALKDGVNVLEPGILADAHRNILYIDEINLLDDHIVDVLLDAAAYGINTVEREGISFSHLSKFILVGTMNPEEGELRGQLSDRIGLTISVSGIDDVDKRIKIIKRREEFEKDPIAFREKFKEKNLAIQKRIVDGRKLLNNITISDYLMEIIARVAIQLSVEGHRSDIYILKCSKSIAAYNSHKQATEDDLEEAINLVLGENPNFNNSPSTIKKQIEKAKSEIKKKQEEKEENKNTKELLHDQNQENSRNLESNNKDLEDSNGQDDHKIDQSVNVKDEKNSEESFDNITSESRDETLENTNDQDLTFNQVAKPSTKNIDEFELDEVGLDIKK